MVAGRLQEKNGFYYIVLSYTDSAGKRRQPWIGTGLPVKGNKKRAEKMLADTRKDFTISKGQVSELSPDMAFSDYMRYWLKMMRTAVTETTYSSYCFNVEKHIIPYFEPLGVTLAGLQPRQIQSFYLHEAETLKNTSILRFHANLHKALKYAVRIDLIASNPVDKVDRPKPQAFMASYYSAEEMEKLFEAAQGHKLELIIQLAAFYGLRRAEVMGLRWEAIDFEAKTLTIRHIVTSTRIDGKKILVEADRAKTKSSLRTLPLVDPIAERLKAVKEQQEYNQKICGNCYNQEYLGYVFVDAMGNLIQPDSVTTGFPQLLKENGLRRIRFHDLRHSCASLLLKEGIPMKQIRHVQDIPRSKNFIRQAAQRILSRYTVLIGAEDDADGRIVFRVVDLRSIIIRIHIDLPGSFGREFGGFQLDQHIGVQNLVVEHHVHIVVGVIHSDPLLRADKHKALTKFQQEIFDLPHQCRFQVTLKERLFLRQT